MRPSFLLVMLTCLASSCVGASVAITTKTVPNGTLGTKYSAVISASGGCTPYAWKIISGSLPAGVSTKPTTNTTSLDLTGTPTKAATYSFTVEVEGCGKHVSETAYRITIQPGANHVVDLSWKASTSADVTGYNVYRSPDDSTWKKINASLVASTLYDDSTVSNGNTYYYSVTAVDLKGQESGRTVAVKVIIP